MKKILTSKEIKDIIQEKLDNINESLKWMLLEVEQNKRNEQDYALSNYLGKEQAYRWLLWELEDIENGIQPNTL